MHQERAMCRRLRRYAKVPFSVTPLFLNEGFLPVKVMEVMGFTKGPTDKDYDDTIDNARILRAEKTTEANRTWRRALKAAENDKFEETEGLLHQA
ncbi:hypothetical protein TNCV_4177211 [Trichonephila clavipes]|nr:hypothetical protein TNCV_4177211 [Trichonephila clavipes]